MFIFWGKKLVYRRVGYVADFCPICRAARTFELKRVGSVGHVYYISFGEGALLGFERTCDTCGTAFEANPSTYTSIAKKPATLSELRAQTFPNLDQVLQERLELEERIKYFPLSLSPAERHTLIRNPFLLLSPKVEKRFASTHIDKEIGFAMLAAIALLAAGPAILDVVAPKAGGNAFLVLVALSVSLVVWQIAVSGRRFMRRQIIPVLAEALRPLKPTEREINAVLAELKQLRHKIASKTKLADIQAQLN